jgi:glutamate-1-semialdehyde 2,1-aminomutase
MKTTKSEQLYKEALEIIPGGVNSPVRACKSVGAIPLFIQRAEGSKIIDADGNDYIDYVGSWGPMILGHRDPDVEKAVAEALTRGTSFGAPVESEIELARLVIDTVPSVESVRMVNSGTEATMSAIRLARGVTGRSIVVKFDGCYHGHADSFLVEAGSGVATLNIPGSPGVPEQITDNTLSIGYNDIAAFESLMQQKGDEIACVIVEPIAGNMGFVKPVEGFLEALRSQTEKYGALLIFDEVMTGFRVALGGAQSCYGITPDLTTLGKIIGGGLPVGAYGGRKDIMAHIAPSGPVYQAGTLSGNPLAMAAGIATLKKISRPGFYESLESKTSRLTRGLNETIQAFGIKAKADHLGSMFGMYFTDRLVNSFKDARTSDLDMFSAYYLKMRNRGIYLAPSQFEAGFVSAAHSNEDIDSTIQAVKTVFSELVKA